MSKWDDYCIRCGHHLDDVDLTVYGAMKIPDRDWCVMCWKPRLAIPEEVENDLTEAERIFRVLKRTGPIIPIQELAAIDAWLPKVEPDLREE